ncbi:hypothetical protein CIT292_09456 [Citrobacter youngae ATCC 29220]|uniref:Uncharacterized protein n=1 Tax=Citrobacter youngae ATCC 29220 TaxID=500640 RepID=D4BF89_9ENTR|nr:hypothetical protein CIT292_09456 [Citrobacter youngae ATCC 29220]
MQNHFCAQILPLKRTLHSSNDSNSRVNMLKKAAIERYFTLPVGRKSLQRRWFAIGK